MNINVHLTVHLEFLQKFGLIGSYNSWVLPQFIQILGLVVLGKTAPPMFSFSIDIFYRFTATDS